MSLRSMAQRLYRGEIDYDFIGHRRYWYGFSVALLVLSFVALGVNQLNLNIDFRGGSEFIVQQGRCDVATAASTVSDAVGGEPRVQRLGSAGDRCDIRVQTDDLSAEQRQDVQQKLATALDAPLKDVSSTFVGPSWGLDVSKNALRGLIAFLVLVVIFLWAYFEWKMAMAALIALIHDLIITIGIYALVGFEVTPSTVIGLLTVLGYSLYDTVVVFDKVKENTAGLLGGSRSTYSEAANLAVNQTLVRSINTSIVSILPVAAIFFVGSYILGAGTLKDISLVLLIGLAAGAYSSILIAAPLLAQFKEREPAMQALARRVAQRRNAGKPVPATASGATAANLEAGGTDFQDDEGGDAAARRPTAAAAENAGRNRSGGAGRNQPRRSQQRRPPGKRSR